MNVRIQRKYENVFCAECGFLSREHLLNPLNDRHADNKYNIISITKQCELNMFQQNYCYTVCAEV